MTQTYNHLVYKRTFNHLAKLPKLSGRFTKRNCKHTTSILKTVLITLINDVVTDYKNNLNGKIAMKSVGLDADTLYNIFLKIISDCITKGWSSKLD